MKKFKCQKCGHEWPPRSDNIPKECPKCKSRKWNNKKEIVEII
jgi:predicted Zn-ribbon and HTH transcriptional regulator